MSSRWPKCADTTGMTWKQHRDLVRAIVAELRPATTNTDDVLAFKARAAIWCLERSRIARRLGRDLDDGKYRLPGDRHARANGP